MDPDLYEGGSVKHLLLIEDDAHLGASLNSYLQTQGYQVTWVMTLAEATATTDLVLLDWNLPDGEGIDWLRRFRQRCSAPVILLTARSETMDKVLGLEIGANDYVTKPFEPRELLARIRVQLRSADSGSTLLESSGIRMDLERHEVSFQGQPIELARMEFQLLRVFLENPRKALSRETLLQEVWGQKSPTTRTVDVHVGQLRQKFAPELFETLHGIGYRFLPAEKSR